MWNESLKVSAMVRATVSENAPTGSAWPGGKTS